MRNLGDCGIRLRVLDLEPGHEHPAASVDGEHERDRPLRGNEGEARVIGDVLLVEENAPRETALYELRRERLAACGELRRRDPHAATFSVVSSARSRRTRSASFGCVTKSAARPCSRKGLKVQSGSVAGEAVKSMS